MSRPLRSLRLYLWQVFLLLAPLQIFFLCLLFGSNPLPESFIFLHIGITTLLAALYGRQHRWLWRFCRHVRRFDTAEIPRFILHYEPELKRGETISALLQSCENELDHLTQWFGSPLRGRVTVYLFAHWQDISAIFGPGVGGWAIFRANAIVIARDNRIPELMRHELTHLFSFRWNALAPPLLSEGLSVWLQGTDRGRPIDSVALPLLRQGGPRVSLLLRSKFFFAEPQRQSCYILAGSFTGFLIRRYGWDRYRKLYRRCDGIRFPAKFEKCFGVRLEKAEWQWRNEVLVMALLNHRLGRKP